jgi:cyclopropane fatty-acyl-phospholipid synthase-like methyltransferase
MLWQTNDTYSGKIEKNIGERYQLARQSEEKAIASTIEELLVDKQVLELGCGGGGWTEAIAKVARSVLAIDNSPDSLAIALQKELLSDKVKFRYGDWNIWEDCPETFDAALVSFWFSRLSKQDTAQFLRKLHSYLKPGAIVFIVDNIYLPESSDRLFKQPGNKDTFKIQQLNRDIKHQTIRNYYDADKLRKIFSLRTSHLKIEVGTCFWWVNYRPI